MLLLGLVSTAEARQFSMSGKWVQRRGIGYIPVRPGSWGIPAISGATVSVQPGGTLTVPANQFGTTVATQFPLPQPTLIQLSTHFTPIGPKSTGVFKAGHWMATRPFKDFAFCPGTPIKPAVGAAANPNCLTPKSEAQGAPPGSGKAHGLIRYKAGTNAYGGTMQMISQGGGVISFLIGATGPTVMHNPFGDAPGAAPTEAPGGPYANTSLTDVLPGGPVTSGAVFSPYGLITVPGTVVGYGTTKTWFHWGFPWTTGKVYLSVTYAGSYMSTFVTLTGSDARTPLGAGNITLVAGGIANGLHSGPVLAYMMFDYVQLQLTPIAPQVPSLSPTGVATGAALMVLAVGYVLRRRF